MTVEWLRSQHMYFGQAQSHAAGRHPNISNVQAKKSSAFLLCRPLELLKQLQI